MDKTFEKFLRSGIEHPIPPHVRTTFARRQLRSYFITMVDLPALPARKNRNRAETKSPLRASKRFDNSLSTTTGNSHIQSILEATKTTFGHDMVVSKQLEQP